MLKIDASIEKGIHGFNELLFYPILILLPLREVIKTQKMAEEQELMHPQSVINLECGLEKLDVQVLRLDAKLNYRITGVII
jgi:hypothetical protein